MSYNLRIIKIKVLQLMSISTYKTPKPYSQSQLNNPEDSRKDNRVRTKTTGAVNGNQNIGSISLFNQKSKASEAKAIQDYKMKNKESLETLNNTIVAEPDLKILRNNRDLKSEQSPHNPKTNDKRNTNEEYEKVQHFQTNKQHAVDSFWSRPHSTKKNSITQITADKSAGKSAHISNVSPQFQNAHKKDQTQVLKDLKWKELKQRKLKRLHTAEKQQQDHIVKRESIYEYCLRTNKAKLKYPELATILERLEAKDIASQTEKKTKEVSIQAKIQKYLAKEQLKHQETIKQLNRVDSESQTNQKSVPTQNKKSFEVISEKKVVPSIKTQDKFKTIQKKRMDVIPQALETIKATEKSQISVEVKLKDMKFPELPLFPDLTTNSKELIDIGRNLYQRFELAKPNEKSHIAVEKYRNCLHFQSKNIHILWYDTGRFYIGEYKLINNQGQKHGHGIELLPQKSIYEGRFQYNKKSGFGTLKYQNDDYYIGDFLGGVQNGQGRLFQDRVEVYNGEWKDGKMEGFGKMTLPNGEVYQGYFSKGVQNGYGTLTFKNGDIYKGNFVEGKFNGLGKYVWANKQSYEGEFLNGARHGTGQWKSKLKNGKHETYSGEYRNDKKSGTGKYIWNEHSYYQGQFWNDQRHGQGVMVEKGKSIKALWQNGIIKKLLLEKREIKSMKSMLRNKKIRSEKKNRSNSKSYSHIHKNSTHKFSRICGCKQHAKKQNCNEQHENQIQSNINNRNKVVLKKIEADHTQFPSRKGSFQISHTQTYTGVQQSSKLNNLYS